MYITGLILRKNINNLHWTQILVLNRVLKTHGYITQKNLQRASDYIRFFFVEQYV